MSNHNTRRSIDLHYKQIHDAETRRAMRNAARLRAHIESHAISMRWYYRQRAEEMILGACVFLSVALVSVGGLMLNS